MAMYLLYHRTASDYSSLTSNMVQLISALSMVDKPDRQLMMLCKLLSTVGTVISMRQRTSERDDVINMLPCAQIVSILNRQRQTDVALGYVPLSGHAKYVALLYIISSIDAYEMA